MLGDLYNRFSRIVKNIKGQGKITDSNISDTLRDVRRALLEADVNYKVVKSFINRVKERAYGKEVFDSITPGQQFIQLLAKEMTSLLGSESKGVDFHSSGRTIILMTGLQGVGKTTTVVKLACFLKNKMQKSPYLIGADLQRPAAIKQLKILAKQQNIPIYSGENNSIKDVINNGLIGSRNADVVIIDTAGRLHIDKELMRELELIANIANPSEILYVADSMMGQDAVNSSKAFNDILEVTGIILTKLDGDTKGGAALSIREVTGKPIKFIGTGERVENFSLFHPDRLANRILGMGDVVSLVEKAQEVFELEKTKSIQESILNDTFNLTDFQEQLTQMKKIGSLSDIMGMLPFGNKLGNVKLEERQLIWTDAIIKSMTHSERESPDIINGSRRKRIAAGSGRTVQEVNQLLKQFQQMRTMMKKIGNKKGKMKFPF